MSIKKKTWTYSISWILTLVFFYILSYITKGQRERGKLLRKASEEASSGNKDIGKQSQTHWKQIS